MPVLSQWIVRRFRFPGGDEQLRLILPDAAIPVGVMPRPGGSPQFDIVFAWIEDETTWEDASA